MNDELPLHYDAVGVLDSSDELTFDSLAAVLESVRASRGDPKPTRDS